jgi:toxin ParE1/3/4
MRVILTPLARAEYVEAVDWYDRQGPGLAQRLRADFRAIRARIVANPLQFPAAIRDTRRALLRNFPYVVIFRISGDVAEVIAFFNTSRDPLQWQRRAQ